jgi:hypothetical protein
MLVQPESPRLVSGYFLCSRCADEGITVFTIPVLSTIVILFVSLSSA